ncbi:MAG: ABC transporter permease [Rhodobacteraceae bacterium]|nr:ABC transporter permease [Paracoccaceae bacterium]
MGPKSNPMSLVKNQNFVLLLIFVALNVYFATTTQSYFQLGNYFNMLTQNAALLLTAAAATLLMKTGNFDLSTTANLAFSGVLYALLASWGLPLTLAAVITLCAGICFGAINGLLVTRYDISPFIATLGMMCIGGGAALLICGGQSVRTGLPDNFSSLMQTDIFGLPTPIVISFVGITVFWVAANYSLIGKYAMAIGSNKNAAALAGINVDRVVMGLFVLVAIMASLAGIMTASRIGSGDPRVAEFFFMDVIVAIMLGGTPLTGGRGTVIGTVIAAMIVIVIGNGLNMLGILVFWQTVIKGVILIMAVTINEKFTFSRLSEKMSAPGFSQ